MENTNDLKRVIPNSKATMSKFLPFPNKDNKAILWEKIMYILWGRWNF